MSPKCSVHLRISFFGMLLPSCKHFPSQCACPTEQALAWGGKGFQMVWSSRVPPVVYSGRLEITVSHGWVTQSCQFHRSSAGTAPGSGPDPFGSTHSGVTFCRISRDFSGIFRDSQKGSVSDSLWPHECRHGRPSLFRHTFPRNVSCFLHYFSTPTSTKDAFQMCFFFTLCCR